MRTVPDALETVVVDEEMNAAMMFFRAFRRVEVDQPLRDVGFRLKRRHLVKSGTAERVEFVKKVLVERILASVAVIAVLLRRRLFRFLFGREVDSPVGQLFRLPAVRLDRAEIPVGAVGTGVVGERQPFPARIVRPDVVADHRDQLGAVGVDLPDRNAELLRPVQRAASGDAFAGVVQQDRTPGAVFSEAPADQVEVLLRVFPVVVGVLAVLRARSVPFGCGRVIFRDIP